MAGLSRVALVLSVSLHVGAACVVCKWLPAGDRHVHGTADEKSAFLLDGAPGEGVEEGPVDTPSGPAVEPPPEPSTTGLPPGGLVAASATAFPFAVPAPAGPASARDAPAPDRSRPSRERLRSSSHGEAGHGNGASTDAGSGGSSGFTPPTFRLRYWPRYPSEARAQRLEGIVLLRVEVDADGRVRSASLQQSSGHAILDRAALAAVRPWRFDPARQNGVAVAAQAEVPVRFRFESDLSHPRSR